MALERSQGYMRGSGDPNLDANIADGGGQIPLMYFDTNTVPPTKYYFDNSQASGLKWFVSPVRISRPKYRTDVLTPTTVFNVGFDLPTDLDFIDVHLNGQEIYPDQTEYSWSRTGIQEITLATPAGNGLTPDFLSVKALVIQ